MRKAVFSLAGFVCLAGFVAARTASVADDAIAYVETPQYDAAAWTRRAERFPGGAAIRLLPGARPLAPGFAASADPEVSFDGARILFAGKRAAAEPWEIFEVARNGAAPRQITSGGGDCIRPFYLPDNRIVYTRGGRWIETMGLDGGDAQRISYGAAPVLTDGVLRDGRILFETVLASGVREVMTVYPDGTGVESIRCDHGADRHSAHQLNSGDIAFVQRDGSLGRFTSALATQTTIAQPRAEFAGAPVEGAGAAWIAALRQNAQERYRLARWNPRTGTLRTIAQAADANAVEPVIIAPREAPKRFPSALVASRTAVNTLCLNAHTSRDPMPEAQIAAVRVFTRSEAGQQELLGETAVEKDGSFFIQIPADRPIRLELTTAAGTVIRAEKTWWWGRAAEQRICTGCHAGPERAPENAVPEVLLRRDVPVKMLIGGSSQRSALSNQLKEQIILVSGGRR